jgi:hypothetical protein
VGRRDLFEHVLLDEVAGAAAERRVGLEQEVAFLGDGQQLVLGELGVVLDLVGEDVARELERFTQQ